MRIFIDGILQNIPEWIKIDSMISGVVVESDVFNDVAGEVYLGETIKSKMLSCSGVVPNANCVDKEVSRLQAILSGKELVIYRSDDAELFYVARLVGDVRANFFFGKKIGKSFSINFSLKVLDGFSYGEGQAISLIQGSNFVFNDGNCDTPMSIQINGPKSLSGDIFVVNESVFSLYETVDLGEDQYVVINKAGMFLFDIDLTDKISDESILNPIMLVPGTNTILSSSEAVMTFNPRYR